MHVADFIMLRLSRDSFNCYLVLSILLFIRQANTETPLPANSTQVPPSISPSTSPSPSLVPSRSSFPVASNTTNGTVSNVTWVCAEKVNCEDCTERSDCVWCENANVCKEGGFWGPKATLSGCMDWRYRRCGAGTNFALLLTFFIICLLVVGAIAICCFFGGAKRHRKRLHRTLSIVLRRIADVKRKRNQQEQSEKNGAEASGTILLGTGVFELDAGGGKEVGTPEESRYLFEENAWDHKYGQRRINTNARFGYGATKEERLARKRMEEEAFFYKF